MTIRTNPIRRIDGLVLEDFEAPLADFLSARAEETFVRNPVPSVARQRRLDRLEGEPEDTQGILGVSAGEISRQARELQGERAPEPEMSPLLTPLEAAERAEGLPLSFDRPTRAAVVDELVRRKRAELRRQSVMSRRSGFGSQLLGFGLDLLTTAADPLNVASAFIPVVGPARFASMVARSGVRSARFTRGAIEGAFGAAVVEPIVLRTAINEQADYDFLDSLLNLALGSILGGGLHVAGGFVSDRLAAAAGRPTVSERLAALSPETRETAARISLAQLLTGSQVDVDPVLRAEEGALRDAFDEVSARPAGPVDDPLVRLRPGDFQDVLVQRGPALARGERVIVRGRELEALTGDRRGFGLAKIIIEHGPQSSKEPRFQVTREDIAALPRILREFEPSRLRVRADGQVRGFDFKVSLPNARFGPRDVVFGISKFIDGDGESRLVTAFVAEPGRRSVERSQRRTGGPGSSSPATNRGSEIPPSEVVDPTRGGQVTPAPRNVSPLNPEFQEDLFDFAARQEDPERLSLPDFEAARRAERDVAGLPEQLDPDAARAELEDAEQLLDEVADALEIPRERLREDLADADDAIEEAEALARAVRAAAICQTRI